MLWPCWVLVDTEGTPSPISRDSQPLAREGAFHMHANQPRAPTPNNSSVGFSTVSYYPSALITQGQVPDNKGQSICPRATEIIQTSQSYTHLSCLTQSFLQKPQ